jgi:hypothetical protein
MSRSNSSTESDEEEEEINRRLDRLLNFLATYLP